MYGRVCVLFDCILSVFSLQKNSAVVHIVQQSALYVRMGMCALEYCCTKKFCMLFYEIPLLVM